MPDRTKAPQIRDIDHFQLPVPERYTLGNGIPVYVVNMGTHEVVKLEILFFAGRPYERKPLVSRVTLGLLKEGTRRYDSAEIAEQFDFYGSSLSFPFNLDTSNITLYSLTKHFDKVLPVFAEMLSDPVFPESELENFKSRNKQRLQVDLQKNDIVAYRQITEHIFGSDHPYGYNSYPETYDSISREDLLEHYGRYYNSGNCLVFLSGSFDKRVLGSLERHLGSALRPGRRAWAEPVGPERRPERVRIDLPDSVQTAIRVGRRLFSRHHPDYHGVFVLNTVLGGYFGSRLMENIREEKGYSYNVYSMLDTMVHDGFLYIGAEVGNEFVDDTLKEIYLEMDRLQEELIDDEELAMVRNYLLGSFLTTLDGPFNVAEWIKNQVTESLPLSFFDESVRTVKAIDAAELRTLARRYLRREDMWEVLVGSSTG